MAKYEFIDGEKATRDSDGTPRYTIKQMCRWLEVSTSGYYEWLARPASATAVRRAALTDLIIKSFDDSDGRYGYRRVHADLLRAAQPCSPELVRRLMREAHLVACQPRRSRKGTTRQAAKQAQIPDLVQRDFTAERPGAKLVGDITYLRCWEGWLYLALVIDCYSRKIVGWAMADNYKTPLITSAIEMAARNLTLPQDAIFHSDRGSNYQCRSVRQLVGVTAA